MATKRGQLPGGSRTRYGQDLFCIGRPDVAIKESESAMQGDPLNLQLRSLLAFALMAADRTCGRRQRVPPRPRTRPQRSPRSILSQPCSHPQLGKDRRSPAAFAEERVPQCALGAGNRWIRCRTAQAHGRFWPCGGTASETRRRHGLWSSVRFRLLPPHLLGDRTGRRLGREGHGPTRALGHLSADAPARQRSAAKLTLAPAGENDEFPRRV